MKKAYLGLFSLLLLAGCHSSQTTSASNKDRVVHHQDHSTATTLPSTSSSSTIEEPQTITFKKSYKIYINPSVQYHNAYIDNIHNEGQVMNNIALLLVNRLHNETNLQVKANLNGLSLNQSVKESNQYNPDVHFAIHSNAGGGTGSEVWISKKSYTFGKDILASLNAIHQFKTRGIKYGDGTDASLYEIKNVLAPSALIEILFHDELNQANFILNHEQEIADAFFDGIVNYFNHL